MPEDCGASPGMCGKLINWLYGFRQAASAWKKFFCELLEDAGFCRGKSCEVVFFRRTRDISVTMHGDDFTHGGLQEDLMWLKGSMESWLEIKFRGIFGMDAGSTQEIFILGRIVRVNGEGIEYEADPKHRKLVMEHFGIKEGSKMSRNNGDREDREEPGDEQELSKEEAKSFRGIAARLNFLSQDDPDLQFPVKQGTREMAHLVKGLWKKLKRVARYLAGREEVVWKFDW